MRCEEVSLPFRKMGSALLIIKQDHSWGSRLSGQFSPREGVRSGQAPEALRATSALWPPSCGTKAPATHGGPVCPMERGEVPGLHRTPSSGAGADLSQGEGRDTCSGPLGFRVGREPLSTTSFPDRALGLSDTHLGMLVR